MQHFDNHNVLCDNQHGFRKRRSCETQLISTIQELTSSKAKGKQVDVILLDFAKAFDKVPHERLIHKLDYYGVRGNTLKWIRLFLSDRQQEVVLDGATSDTAQVTSGVPQGTILGPLLFLVFIHDLPEFIKNSKWVWSGNTTITNCRQPRGTARKSRSTITRHQEDKLSKAISSLFPIKMIAILEWT